MKGKNYITKLSPHLFWDVDINSVDEELHKQFIVSRVIKYGLLSDWNIIRENIGVDEIGKLAIKIKDLDEKSCSFISLVTKIPIEEFACYITKQSQPKHWND
ncbi:MAG: hypothetical protein WCQ70_10485 [Lentimicrobiaceae bacterium]